MLTQSYLKKILKYNPDTGIFVWRINSAKNIKANDIAGTTSHGYIVIQINNKPYGAHRLAWFYMTGKWPKAQIDHGDHVRSNNKWPNLDEATCQENGKNQSIRKTNTSKITGVYFNKRNKIWVAQININKKPVGLGGFKDKFEAICCRKSAERRHGYHENHGK